ncbi:hypothetical protein KUM42_17740 [Modestobacter sp. L9-4]|jgi:hypothetical protein|uniref:hypothetical protein n=1 Tax=Modestobacter sp. L9-4 TaxID=2851567 RepID=UPI001C7924C8|nr:hypothetical protein [Modestobacter sp. L9-4]QXG75621.1 hypothetical protein KUM42_17740 [Modestobacter sp. L9-4]
MLPRRPVVTLVTALAVLAGTAALAGCDAAPDANTGTSSSHAVDRAGNDPSGVLQGHLPDLSNSVPGGDGRSTHRPGV